MQVLHNSENKHESLIQEGFETSLVVTVDHHWDGYWSTEIKEVVKPSEVQKACLDNGSSGYYWLVRRSNGSMYPFPLLFVSQEERQKEADRYNGEKWRMFYAGVLTSESLHEQIVDCPTEWEIDDLLAQVEAISSQCETPWDDLDTQGGLVPRWAA